MSFRFAHSVKHACHGVRQVWIDEPNFRIQTAIAVIVSIAMMVLHFSYTEAAIILYAFMLVLGAEMFNTLVEDLLDVIEPNHHKAVGKMKDMMAGVVLVFSSGAALVGLLVFLHHFQVAL